MQLVGNGFEHVTINVGHGTVNLQLVASNHMAINFKHETIKFELKATDFERTNLQSMLSTEEYRDMME